MVASRSTTALFMRLHRCADTPAKREGRASMICPHTGWGGLRLWFQVGAALLGTGFASHVCRAQDCGDCGAGGIDVGWIDGDGDGVLTIIDNCPAAYNPGQEDSDGDAIGDLCDPDTLDSDADGV